MGEVGLSLKDPCNHKLTNKCNARVFYGGGGPLLPVLGRRVSKGRGGVTECDGKHDE